MAKYTEFTGCLLSLGKFAQHHCFHGLYQCSFCISLCWGGHDCNIPEAALLSRQVLSCVCESPRLDCEDLTWGTILLLLPLFVLKCFIVSQDKVCFPSCVRATGPESASHVASSLYFTACSSGLGLLFSFHFLTAVMVPLCLHGSMCIYPYILENTIQVENIYRKSWDDSKWYLDVKIYNMNAVNSRWY